MAFFGSFGEAITQKAHHAGKAKEDERGHARNQAHEHANRGPGLQDAGIAQHLAAEFGTEARGAGNARDDDTGGRGNEQRRDLADKAVADGEQRVAAKGLAKGHAALEDANEQATHDVDGRNDETGDGVAAYELRRTVHGAVEVRLAADLLAPALGFVLFDGARGEFRVDGHLLAGQGVKGETGRDFGNTPGALGDDHEVDDDENEEDDDADDAVAADDKVTEGLDDLADVGATLGRAQKDETGRGDVEAQAEQGRDQQEGRQSGELQGPQDVDRGQQDKHADGDVDRKQTVQHHCRHRQDHQTQHGNEAQQDGQVLGQSSQIVLHSAWCRRRTHTAISSATMP